MTCILGISWGQWYFSTHGFNYRPHQIYVKFPMSNGSGQQLLYEKSLSWSTEKQDSRKNQLLLRQKFAKPVCQQKNSDFWCWKWPLRAISKVMEFWHGNHFHVWISFTFMAVALMYISLYAEYAVHMQWELHIWSRLQLPVYYDHHVWLSICSLFCPVWNGERAQLEDIHSKTETLTLLLWYASLLMCLLCNRRKKPYQPRVGVFENGVDFCVCRFCNLNGKKRCCVFILRSHSEFLFLTIIII